MLIKEGTDKFRSSIIQGVMKRVKANGINVVAYGPCLGKSEFFGSKFISDLDGFKQRCGVIIANRKTECL